MAKTAAERQRAKRERLAEQGAKQVLITLSPAAVWALEWLQQPGRTKSEAVEHALLLAIAGKNTPEKAKAKKVGVKSERLTAEEQARTTEALTALKDRGVAVHEVERGKDGVFRKSD